MATKQHRFFISIITAFMLFLSACATTENAEQDKEQEAQSAEQGKSEAATPAHVHSEASAVAPEAAVHKDHNAHKEHAAEKHHEVVVGVDPDQSLKWLKNGNIRFRKNRLRKDGQSKKDIERLSKGQKPHTIIVSCSDSRVPPEVVFDQKLGEIFVVRTAGQTADFGSIASIEYAVSHLGSRLILVLGHESCGAVKAGLDTINGGDAGSPALNILTVGLHVRLQAARGMPRSERLVTEGWMNVDGAAKDLLEKSAIIREKVESGTVKIARGLYHLGNGEVEFK